MAGEPATESAAPAADLQNILAGEVAIRIQVLTHDISREEIEELEDLIAKTLGADIVSRSRPDEERKIKEAEEEEPAIILAVSDADGTPVRVITGPTAAGLHRVTWDLRLPPVNRRVPPATSEPTVPPLTTATPKAGPCTAMRFADS